MGHVGSMVTSTTSTAKDVVEPCQALVLEWRRLPQGLLRRLVGSMHRQCQALFAAQGGYTGYLIDMVIFETPYFLKGLLNSSVGFDRKRLRCE